MDDMQISVTSAAAWALWAVAAVFAVANIFTTLQLGGMVVVFGCGAGTLHVRACLFQQARDERNAFELGVDVGQQPGDRVTRLR